MVIAVAAVIVVQMPLNDVIGVVTMRGAFVPAIGSVPVLRIMTSTVVLRSTCIRIGRVHSQRMLIHVVAVDMVQMTIHEVINVVPMGHCLMATGRPVNMRLLMSCAVVVWRAFLRVRRVHLNAVLVHVPIM